MATREVKLTQRIETIDAVVVNDDSGPRIQSTKITGGRGDKVTVSDGKAKELIDLGYAVPPKQDLPEVVSSEDAVTADEPE